MMLTYTSGGFEVKSSDLSKNRKDIHSLMLYNSCTPAEDLLLMVELRKKILTFRDIIDLPHYNDGGSVHELVIRTVEELHKLYPRTVHSVPSELNRKSTYQVLSRLYNTLICIRDLWISNHKWLSKFKYENEGDSRNISLGQLGDRVLAQLDYMIMIAREMFDVMDEDGSKCGESPRNSIYGETLDGSYSSTKASSCQSPVTPTSVLPEYGQSFADVSYSPPLLWPLRLQAVGKLKPTDVKRLSFHMFPHVASQGSSPENERKKVDEIEPEKKRARNNSKSVGVTADNGESIDHTVNEVAPKNQQTDLGIVTSDGNHVQNSISPFAPKAPPLPPLKPETKGLKALIQPNVSTELQKILPKVSTGRPPESFGLLSREPSLTPATLPPDIPELSPEDECAAPEVPLSAPNSISIAPPPPPPPPPPPLLPRSVSTVQPSILESNASAEQHPTSPSSMLQEGPSTAPPSMSPQNAPQAAPSPPPLPPMLPSNPLTSPPLMFQDNASPAPHQPMLQPNESTTPPPAMSETNASTAPTPPPPPMLQSNLSAPPLPPPPPPILQSNSSKTPPPPPPPMMQPNASTAPPPPPPILPSRGSVPSPPPPMTPSGGSPPPPPPGAGRGLSPKKANTKLKRSSHMGKLYRVLKGKVEGSNQDVKASSGKKNISAGAGGAGGGKQSMADALAEMTKRSSYFQQIEEDVQKHGNMVREMKKEINSFQTNDVAELLKFHQHVESHLEKLTDETQVLARFEDFPSKKLETLRTAAALYSKLNAMLTNLTTWKVETPLAGVLDKVENYFNKIKGDVDALDRTKDEECKRFQSNKINLDLQILVRIKEAMVDLSSSCMEFALKERREAKVAMDGESGPKNEKRLKACTKMLWRAFQLAFRVYTFAGGHDDRADMLSRELAQEIENEDHQSNTTTS